MKEYLIKLYEKYPDKYKTVENIISDIENLNLYTAQPQSNRVTPLCNEVISIATDI
jgi:hypothetical protein